MSLNGVQVTNMHHHEVTPVILINLNLPPEECYKVVNILASMIISGPKKPKNLDLFLWPLVDELKQLDYGIKAFDAIIIIIALTPLTSLIEYADPLPSYHTGKTMPESC